MMAPKGISFPNKTSTGVVLASWQYSLLSCSEYWGKAHGETTRVMMWSYRAVSTYYNGL